MTDAVATDGALWQAASLRPDAFGILFDRHADAVYNHCFRRTGSWSTAEDLMSGVFLDAWRRRRDVRLDVDGSILPWLLAVANNAIRNQRRFLRRQHRLMTRLPPALPLAGDGTDSIIDRVDSQRQMQVVLDAIQDLSDAEKDVLSLCVWSELSYEAAAVALGIPVGTVRSRLSRARQKLRTKVDVDDKAPAI